MPGVFNLKLFILLAPPWSPAPKNGRSNCYSIKIHICSTYSSVLPSPQRPQFNMLWEVSEEALAGTSSWIALSSHKYLNSYLGRVICLPEPSERGGGAWACNFMLAVCRLQKQKAETKLLNKTELGFVSQLSPVIVNRITLWHVLCTQAKLFLADCTTGFVKKQDILG